MVRRFNGFTLIEMLIVVVIITVLSGMVMSMISQAKRTAMKSNTLSIERKVETALHLFKDEMAVYPYQLTYPALSPTVPNQYYPNGLYYHVGTNISTAAGGDRDNVMADVNSAKAEFAYTGNLAGYWGGEGAPSGNYEAVQPSVFTYTENTVIMTGSMHKYTSRTATGDPPVGADLITPDPGDGRGLANRMGISFLNNRMAQEQVGDAMLAGAITMKGPVIFDQFGVMIRDQSSLTILTNPASVNNPGYAIDYLAGDIDAHYINGNDILDAWHNPLVYISQNIPGVKATTSQTNGCTLMPYDTRYYGLGPQGFDAGSGPTASVVAANRRILLNSGRLILNLQDAGDGQPTAPDATYFPDAGNLLQSDMRYYAAPGYETEFEVWSAGYDGKFSYLRSDAVDADNISATEYNRGLK